MTGETESENESEVLCISILRSNAFITFFLSNLTVVYCDRTSQQAMLSDEDQEEKTRKCEFVQGLLLSTILDDNM